MMNTYNEILENGVNVLLWWESLVKPGIIEIAIQRKRKIKENSMQCINLLNMLQGQYTSNLLKGIEGSYENLIKINQEIQEWYQLKCQIAVQQFKHDEICQSEKIRIYHLAENKRILKRTSMVKIIDEDDVTHMGHAAVVSVIENNVANHLLNIPQVDPRAQKILLKKCFTEDNIKMINQIPSKREVSEVLKSCNSHASPGTDGITAFFYKKFWNIGKICEALTKVV